MKKIIILSALIIFLSSNISRANIHDNYGYCYYNPRNDEIYNQMSQKCQDMFKDRDNYQRVLMGQAEQKCKHLLGRKTLEETQSGYLRYVYDEEFKICYSKNTRDKKYLDFDNRIIACQDNLNKYYNEQVVIHKEKARQRKILEEQERLERERLERERAAREARIKATYNDCLNKRPWKAFFSAKYVQYCENESLFTY